MEDYDAIPQDFINLGFSPEGVTEERLKQSGITEGLTFAFRQLSKGGGPKMIQQRVKEEFQQRYGAELSDKELREAARAEMLQRMEAQLESEGVDVKGVTNVMEEISRRNRELFALPPYVLYVARAFSTLEGIGLSIDENYSIVQECYPYLARRLFTDRSPRAKKALKAMLGLNEADEEEKETSPSSPRSALAFVQDGAVKKTKPGALSPAKLIEMSEGFASYTSATAAVDRDGAGQTAAAREFANLLIDPKGSTLQDILVDEYARLGDAATRKVLQSALVKSPAARAAADALKARKRVLEQLPFVRLLPKPLKEALIDRPAEFPDLVEALVATSEQDERILASAVELAEAISKRTSSSGSNPLRSFAAKQLNDGATAIPSTPPGLNTVSSFLSDAENRKALTDSLPGVANLGRRVGAGLLRRAAYRSSKSTALPERVRKTLKEANEALADAVDVKEDEATSA